MAFRTLDDQIIDKAKELGIDINGTIILQLNKNSVSYNEYMLDFNNNDHLNFINHCERCFLSLVYSSVKFLYFESKNSYSICKF